MKIAALRRALTAPTTGWTLLITVAGAFALASAVRWAGAVASASPVVYGEGAAAHAAELMRWGLTYRDAAGDGFTGANYGPLYYFMISLGDPFTYGRLLSLAATTVTAAAIAWRARAQGPVAAVGLSLAFLALPPVLIWGGALRPDPLTTALTVAAVLLVESRRHHSAPLAAVLLVLAAGMKPTALVPAAALLGWLWLHDRKEALRFIGAGTIGTGALVAALAPLDLIGVSRHVVGYNAALAFRPDHSLLLLAIGIVLLWPVLTALGCARTERGPLAAYAIAGTGIALMGGREGATLNYLVDLCAAGALLVGAHLGALTGRRRTITLVAVTAQLLLAAALISPWRSWLDPRTIAAARAEVRPGEVYLAEEAALLTGTGARSDIDDLFLWSALVRAGRIDPEPTLERVRRGYYTGILSDSDLERLEDAPDWAADRWTPALRTAVLERYRLTTRAPGLYVYRPR